MRSMTWPFGCRIGITECSSAAVAAYSVQRGEIGELVQREQRGMRALRTRDEA